jgi:hypothetical protein
MARTQDAVHPVLLYQFDEALDIAPVIPIIDPWLVEVPGNVRFDTS